MKSTSFAIILLFILFTTKVKATHIVGGEVTYACQGVDPNNSNNHIYTITMNIYRDCIGGQVGFDSAPGVRQLASITVFSGAPGFPYVTSKYLAPPTTSFVEPLNGPCIVSPPNICVQQGVYVYDLSLPLSDDSYFVVYQRCCRNGTISNISNPGDSGATFFIEITSKAQAECNSSPVFTNTPSAFACVNRAMNYDNSAVDADGDQLIYEFCAPKLGAELGGYAPHPDAPPPYDPVNFISPTYNFDNPMGGNPQITIDPNTGQITGTPEIQGQFVVGICVKEFRDGELLSVVQRDFQFNITFCELLVNPILDAPEIDGKHVFTSCDASPLTIINQSENEDFIDEYYWEFEIPGSAPLVFNTRDVTLDFPEMGTYCGKMILNPGGECNDSLEVQVNVMPPVLADFEFEYDTCEVEPVNFTDLSQPGGVVLKDWDWDFGDGGLASEQNPDYQYQAPGSRTVQLLVTDSLGCMDSVAYEVSWFPAPAIILIEPDNFNGCHPEEIAFNNLSSPVDDSYEFFWDFGDGKTSTERNPSHLYEDPGLYTVSIEITSPFGCFESADWNNLISIGPTPRAGFSFSPEEICSFEPEVQFEDQSADASRWFWSFDEDGFSNLPNPAFVFPDTGLQQVSLIVENEYACRDSVIQTLDIVPKVTYYLPNAFTPNNDGVNDFFQGSGIMDGVRNFKLSIWNRWGELIFETTNPDDSWNGRKNNSGKAAQAGVYLCIINYTEPRGRAIELKGFATLIR